MTTDVGTLQMLISLERTMSSISNKAVTYDRYCKVSSISIILNFACIYWVFVKTYISIKNTTSFNFYATFIAKYEPV
jgi:hypothetical protein